MKPLKPGQICTIRGNLYQAKKKDEYGCKKCDLNNPFLCPRVMDTKTKKMRFNCYENCVILVKLN